MGQRDGAYPTRPARERKVRRIYAALVLRRAGGPDSTLAVPPNGGHLGRHHNHLHGMPAVRAEGAERRDPVPALRGGLSIKAAPAVRAWLPARPAATGARRGRRPGPGGGPARGGRAAPGVEGRASDARHAASSRRRPIRSPTPRPRPPGPAGGLPASVTPAAPRPLARRFARTWVNVRGGRGRATPAVRVLNPGDAVQVDSLSRGWYRVLIDGRAAGYVHRSNLDPVSPPR